MDHTMLALLAFVIQSNNQTKLCSRGIALLAQYQVMFTERTWLQLL